MKNLVSMNAPYMLVITLGLSLNGWIKNEKYAINSVRVSLYRKCSSKKLTFHVEKRRKRPRKYNFQIILA